MRETRDEQVVILCGGQGTRLREETEFKPKALVEIGGRPIIWHLMRIYDHWGFRRFVLCLGYKSEMIKDYFLNYRWRDTNFKLNLREGTCTPASNGSSVEDWEITFVETGELNQTGSRLFQAKPYIDGDDFLFNYSDGLSDIDLDALLSFHRSTGKTATLTGFHPRSRYGVVRADEKSVVYHWHEKPLMTDLTSGGFFVMNRQIFDYLDPDPDCVFETGALNALASDRELALYKHEGFWYSMDTYKEAQALNEMWESGSAKWMVWK